MTKKCNQCKIEKSVSEFHKRGDKWQPYCKECKKEQDKKYKRKKVKYTAEQRLKFKKWAQSFKEGKPCTDCKKSFHFVAMQWDHLPQYKKSFSLSSARQENVSKKRYLEEMTKCELVCANCHAVRTFNRRESLL